MRNYPFAEKTLCRADTPTRRNRPPQASPPDLTGLNKNNASLPRCLFFNAPTLIWIFSHFQNQLPSLQQFACGETKTLQLLSVQQSRLNITVRAACIFCNNGECLSASVAFP